MSDKLIGLLGGTFDPVHHGHLRLALECLQAADLAHVTFIPLHSPPHRETVYAKPEQRLRMLQLATDGYPDLKVDDMEIRRGGVSYSIDTARELRRIHGNRPLSLIMGMDAFQKINTWKQWDLLLDLVHIIVTDRPDAETDIQDAEVARLYSSRHTSMARDLHTSTAGRIYKINIPLLAISSTRIRQLFKTGRNPGFLLPDNVISYIQDDTFYSGKK